MPNTISDTAVILLFLVISKLFVVPVAGNFKNNSECIHRRSCPSAIVSVYAHVLRISLITGQVQVMTYEQREGSADVFTEMFLYKAKSRIVCSIRCGKKMSYNLCTSFFFVEDLSMCHCGKMRIYKSVITELIEVLVNTDCPHTFIPGVAVHFSLCASLWLYSHPCVHVYFQYGRRLSTLKNSSYSCISLMDLDYYMC